MTQTEKGGHHRIKEFKLLNGGEEKGELMSLTILMITNSDGHHGNYWHNGRYFHDGMTIIMTIVMMTMTIVSVVMRYCIVVSVIICFRRDLLACLVLVHDG